MRTVKPKGKAIDINKYINTGYDKVVLVADNMEMLKKLTLILDDNGFKNVVAHLNDIVVVANSITNVVTVSGIADDVVVVANNVSDVVVVSHNIEDIKLVAEHIQAVQRVADSANNVDRLALSANALDIVATSVVSVDKVAASIDAVESVSSILSSVVRVSASADNVDIVANDIDAIKAVPTYMTEIRQAVTTTTTNAQTSTTNAASALASKNAASASEIAANASKVASKASQDAAKMSELAAYSSELSSLANAEAAEASKTAAKAAETNAIANSNSSYNYSELARGYANAAEVSKGESIQAAADSSTSASASLSSANAAKVSENAAKASQTASKTSETAAKASETASKASEVAAKTSENTAIAKATQTAADAVKTGNDVVQSAANAALAEAAKEESQAIAAALTGGIVDKGAWDASTGVFPAKPTRPIPEGGTALVSAFWKVTVAGTAGGISFLVGDDLRFSASTDSFYKVDNTDAVASVQGKTGAVTLSASEVGALATPTGTFAINKVIVAGSAAGTSQYSPYTIDKSVPSNAVFTDTVYTHPTTDGNLHVPATGTTNNGKALVAGATAGSAAWRALVTSDIGGLAVALDAKLDATANAVSATKLQNAVTINGVAFDGSANITVTAASPFALTRGTGLTGANYNGAAATTWAVAYGTAAGTACQGNDARLSDARTPLAHAHTIADTTGLQSALDAKYSATNKPTPADIGAQPAGSYSPESHIHSTATTGANGFMSSADKTKLDNIAANANNYSLPAATSAVRGGIEIFSDTVQTVAANAVSATAGKTYGVQVNAAGQAVVNVPWVDTNTVYTHPTSDGSLHVPATGTVSNGKVLKAGATTGSMSWGSLTAAEVGAAATTHTHAWSDLSGIPIYATRWPTVAEIGAAASSHTHPWAQITGAPVYTTRWPTWGEVSDKPSTMPPSAHTHTIADITSLQTSLDAKQEIDTQKGALVAARYLSNGTSTVGTKIRLPFLTNAGRMVCFTVRVYQNYQTTDVLFSGYLYAATNQWHVPKAVVSAGSTGLNVKMGRDADGRAYVWLQGSDYRGVAVLDVVGGYVAANWNTGWEISESDTVPNLALDTTIYPPYSPNNKPTPADIGALPAGSNAVSATKLQSAVTINGVAFDGSSNITITAANPTALTRGAGLTGANYNGDSATTWAVAYGTAAGTACQGNDSRLSDARTPLAHSHGVADVTGLQALLDSKYSSGNTNIGTGASNYAAGNHTHAYAPLTGVGTSGTWPISVSGSSASTTGNAATATTLQTARTLTIGSTGKTFNGSANVAWSLAEIGAAAISHIHSIQDITDSPYKDAVRVATTAALTATYVNGTSGVGATLTNSGTLAALSVDGVALAVNDRILIKDQAAPAHNGIYKVSNIGSASVAWILTRAVNSDSAPELAGAITTVDQGAVNGGKLFTNTFKSTDTVGTTACTWTEVAMLTSNVASATKLATARTINGVSFDGTANITVADSTKLPLAGGTMTGGITFAAGQVWPTFNQSTSGNAATATTLQTARTINGTSFNGSANITTANWGTARTLTIGNTGKSVDGTSNVAWSLAEIGAQPAGSYAAALHSHAWADITGTPTTLAGYGITDAPTKTGSGASGTWPISVTGSSASTTGNAATATKLQTARTINGTAFDGTANITITAAANGGTSAACSGNSATATLASTVVVNGSADNNFYDMLWRSGNTVYAANSSKAQLNPATGDMRLGGHISFAYTSDENLKTGIKQIDNALDKVCSLRASTYVKKSILPDDDGKHTYTPETGFIAQDLEKVIPNLVCTNEQGYKVIRGGGFEIEALLAAAIKEMKMQHDAEIAELKQQIVELKSLL